jgi:hypothetical protein
LQETRRPHLFRWDQAGHGSRATMPGGGERILPLDLRTDQTLPAFTNGSLDDNPGTGSPENGDPAGQVNAYLYWETKDVVDQPLVWEMTIGLIEQAPERTATVNVTPRRCQQFRLKPGERVTWTNTPSGRERPVQSGEAVADQWGLVTLERVLTGKSRNRLRISRAIAQP